MSENFFDQDDSAPAPRPQSSALKRAGMAWLGELTRGDNGPHATVANAIICLCNDPELRTLLAYDEFAYRVMIRCAPPAPYQGATPAAGPYPRPLDDGDVTLIQAYLQRVDTLRVSQQVAEQAIEVAAQQHRIHPVRDWLARIKWDNTPRLATWISKAFGTPDDDYHREVGIKYLVAAVRRVRKPGTKFDSMLVLEGPQELGKSSSCRALFGDDWFSDELPDMRSKDAPIAMMGVWGVEIAELGAIIRAEIEVVKAFITRQVDKYRPVYGRRTVERPRQTMLVGTTNDTDYLRDSTGNRRFWPIVCTRAEAAWIYENREQLWAEAAALEADGESVWLEEKAKATAREVQAERVPEDMWATLVWDYIHADGLSLPHVTVADILSKALNLPVERRDRKTELRVGAILRMGGWEKKTVRVGTGKIKAWFPNGQ